MIDHVIGRCTFKEHAQVRMESGVTAKLYGPWFQSKDKDSISFVNLEKNDDEQKSLIEDVVNFPGTPSGHSNSFLLGDNSRNDNTAKEQRLTRKRKDDLEACFLNALAMLLELEALYVTSKQQGLVQEADFQDDVVTQLRKYELTMHQLGEWAQRLLRVIATAGEYQNMRLRRFGPDVLEWLRTGLAQFTPPTSLQEGLQKLEPITQVKR